jgi:hypothetical protein
LNISIKGRWTYRLFSEFVNNKKFILLSLRDRRITSGYPGLGFRVLAKRVFILELLKNRNPITLPTGRQAQRSQRISLRTQKADI